MRPLEPIDNAVTITNIASFETGAVPGEHGIIGHAFATMEGEELTPVSGFSRPFSQPTYWELAAASGKQVLSLGALIMHGQHSVHENVDIWAQGQQLAQAAMIDLNNPALLLPLELGGGWKLDLASNNDTLEATIIDPDGGGKNPPGSVSAGQWFEFDAGHTEDGRIRSFRLQYQGEGIIYFRPAYANRGSPRTFLDQLEHQVGGSAGWPNIPAYAAGQISDDVLMDEIHRELDAIMDVFGKFAAADDYDLIMVDYPAMDRFGHAFLSQLDDIDSGAKARQNLDRLLVRMSKDLDRINAYANREGYELLVASGHGFSPIHSALNLNAHIDQAFTSRADEWLIRGVPAKVSAHLYLNPALDDQQKHHAVAKLSEYLHNLKDPITGKPVVDYLVTGFELAEMGHDHPDSGDLFVMLQPGFVFQPAMNSDRPLFDQPTFKGDHGYSAKHAQSMGMVITHLSSIQKVTDIAPHIRSTMRLNPEQAEAPRAE